MRMDSVKAVGWDRVSLDHAVTSCAVMALVMRAAVFQVR